MINYKSIFICVLTLGFNVVLASETSVLPKVEVVDYVRTRYEVDKEKEMKPAGKPFILVRESDESKHDHGSTIVTRVIFRGDEVSTCSVSTCGCRFYDSSTEQKFNYGHGPESYTHKPDMPYSKEEWIAAKKGFFQDPDVRKILESVDRRITANDLIIKGVKAKDKIHNCIKKTDELLILSKKHSMGHAFSSYYVQCLRSIYASQKKDFRDKKQSIS